MKTTIAVLVCALCAMTVRAGDEPVSSLRTRFASAIDTDRYPRPQLVRADWACLNGEWGWEEARADGTSPPPFGRTLRDHVRVPFPLESQLSGIGRQVERSWYRTTFEASRHDDRRTLLHFEAVDWEATVWVNGVRVGSHRGGYDPFTLDVTEQLNADGTNELIVGVFDPSDGGDQPRGKQVKRPESIWYTPTTGIWQTVWIERVPATHVTDVRVETDEHAASFAIVDVAASSDALTIEVTVSDGGEVLGCARGKPGEKIALPIGAPKLWSPDSPFLYSLKIALLDGDRRVDRVDSYCAVRWFEMKKDARGVNRIFLNGAPIFLVGPLDQGFWPDGLYTAPSDAALEFDVAMTKRLGFNMTRKHVKVEPDRWYWHCDRLGLVVIQDMPSADNKTPDGKANFERELDRMIDARRSHPCIGMWVVFNEGWGQFDTERLTDHVKRRDPTRLVNNATGWTDKNCGDVIDIHNYPDPATPPREEHRAAMLGEFGGLGLAIPGHLWKPDHWGYAAMADGEHLTSRYETFLQRAYQMNQDDGLAAIVYTQLTDVEIETNGLLTYDRAIVKPDLERVAAANRGDFSKMPPPPIMRTIVPTSESAPQAWRYTTEKPDERWSAASFDDSGWQTGNGGFGTRETPGAVVGTPWTSGDIWIRRRFSFDGSALSSPRLRVHHDEDCEVFVNGVRVLTLDGFTQRYDDFAPAKDLRAVLVRGENVFAVHCKQTRGGQVIDVGIVDSIPAQR